MDLHGILNQNEYYTNHYFTTIFEENAGDTISSWRQVAKEDGTKTPWASFRDTGKTYYRSRERYLQLKNKAIKCKLIEDQAIEFIAALGYGEPHSENIDFNEEVTIPVFHEEKKPNGAPLLWIMLSVEQEQDDDVLQGVAFGRKSIEDDGFSVRLPETNDEILAKLFFAGNEAPRWILLIGINSIALIDRNKWDKKKYLQFDLDEIFSRHEETTFQALAVLLHRESLCPEEGNSLLDTLDENSYRHSSGVSDSLKYALRECIELLGNEVLYDMRTRQHIDFSNNSVDAGELTIECLRYMYRILFMLFIEAREELGFAPMKSDVYQKGYSLEGVRDVCEHVRDLSAEAAEGYYIDETISSLFEMIYMGYPDNPVEYKKALKIESPRHMFTIEPLKAHIFDPQYTKLINEAKLRNITMLKIVDLMSISRPSSAKERKGRISYSALGINQMGAVYEALLSYRGFIAEEDLYEVKRAGDKFNELDVGYFVPEKELEKYTEDERVRYEDYERRGKLRMYKKGTFIYRLAGREREKSASYYTPEVLTKCLVKYALKELLKDKGADEILKLTVCEPAMGSAAFLNEAISQLAEAYLEKKQIETGIQIAFDRRQAELQKVKMFIADRNVYGVDLNPVAVELAEVSLWLNTIYKGALVPWFGTQLACGNSLIGARRQVYNASKLKRGTWFNDEPEKIPEEWVTEYSQSRKVYKRKRPGSSYIYHFLVGDPGMAKYTDKVIKDLEPENIKLIKAWQKEFCTKYSDDDIEILNRLSEIIDDLWMRTIYTRQTVEKRTEDPLSVFGHDEVSTEGHLTIREKDSIYKKVYKSEGGENASPYARLKAAMDYWCALWFWPIDKAELLPSRQEFFMELSLILEGRIASTVKKNTTIGQMEFLMDEQGQFMGFGTQGSELAFDVQAQITGLGFVNLDQLRELYPRLRIAHEIAEQQHFMHWELEFADLFYERGGFDLVIGNPPWVKIEWNEQNILSEDYPIFMVKDYSANQVKEIRASVLMTGEIWKKYVHEYESISGQQSYLNAISNYRLLKGQQTNLYKCFLPISWSNMNTTGVVSFLHPNGVFDDPSGGVLRKRLYHLLSAHYEFQNEMKLFADVGNRATYSINIYHSYDEKIYFDTIANLYSPSTIDDCYDNDDLTILGIKNDKGEWNIRGNISRVVHVSKDELILFARLFDDSDDWEAARIPLLQMNDLISVFQHYLVGRDQSVMGYKHYSTKMWDETNAQKAQLIRRKVHFSSERNDVIYSGPHIGVANPIYKTSQRNCNTRRAFDVIDLENIGESYVQRTNYVPGEKIEEHFSRIPKMDWGKKYHNTYRVVSREMANVSGERTLFTAIIPPGTNHINTIYGVCFEKDKWMLLLAGYMASLPYDFYVKATGKGHVNNDLVEKFPLFWSEYSKKIINRILMLNCLRDSYSDIWKRCSYGSSDESWAKRHKLLDNQLFDMLDKEWGWSSPLRSDYLRREALIEIDVLAAMSLGYTLRELKTIYKIQFPVLKMYEDDTWYDQNGRIVFTNNRSLTGIGFERKDWEKIKDLTTGTISKIIIDDTMPCGSIERKIEYVAPFERCDREKDYEEVWAYFEAEYKS